MRTTLKVCSLALLFCLPITQAARSQTPEQRSPQSPPRIANSNAAYRQLRGLLPGGEALAVSQFRLKRDAAVFTFSSGTFTLFGEVNGKITGAVFQGQGSIELVPPTAEEKRSIALLTHEPSIKETFETAVLRFTDGTAAEIRKAATDKAAAGGAAVSAARQFNDALRTKLHTNLHVRLLEDVLSPAPGGFFLASIDGKKYASRMIYIVDPHGAEDVAPEEVELMTWNEMKRGVWTAFHLENAYHNGRAAGLQANGTYRIEGQDLTATIGKGGRLDGVARTTIAPQVDGVAVVPLSLFHTLRVASVTAQDGTPLDFIQEDKNSDPDFAVILPAPLKRGEKYTITVTYSGTDAVKEEGGRNYYLVESARESWYPNAHAAGLGGYSPFHMTFSVPKGLDLIATGKKIREANEGRQTITEWQTEAPIPVAGFNLGSFKKAEGALKSGFVVDAYANTELPDWANSLQRSASGADKASGVSRAIIRPTTEVALGTMTTTGALKTELAQGEVAVALYSDYFGALPFHNLALTQQTACNYGQSWPTLVYLPICAFWDATIQHQLGLDRNPTYWEVVTPHEVAHQWWGQTVGFSGYRDQWMSEGFAHFSAALFLQATQQNSEFRDFWKVQRRLLTEKNVQGFRPIDVGPVTMGYRLVNSKSGEGVYRNLVYPKGAYILHMVRMMMQGSSNGDALFRATMQDFVNSYKNKPATTEDFKTVLERHLPPSMDLEGNGRLDWFFDEYVYGTALPSYSLWYDLAPTEKGAKVHFKLTQGNVTDRFQMAVPFYAELADGRVIRLGTLGIKGNNTREQTVDLPQLPSPIKRVMINYNYDVLSTEI